MPRKPEPSFSLKQIIWDIAASIGTDNFSAFYREVDKKLRQLHKKEELYEDETPDIRTLHRIIELDIQRLPPEVVVAKLPRHVWYLRNDYEAIERLAASLKSKQEAATEPVIEQKPYEETPHKQKMRELAGRLIGEIRLPWVTDSFIVELKPQRVLYADSRGNRLYPPIIIAKDEKISVEISIEGKGEIDHLHKGLRSHLETGNFSQVLDEIGNWRQGVADNLARCHGLFALIKKKLEKSYSVSFPLKDEGQLGFTMWFPITICANAIEQARGSAHFRDFQYTHEGLNLKFGAYGIYGGIPNEDLESYEDAHKRLRAKYGTHKQAKEIAKQRKELYQIQAKIGQQLQKFMDMERLPGHCELCS